ncbi:MAG: PRTRC system ThiF family protein [Bacteroidota bacterium]
MTSNLTAVHIIDNYFINPTNPITVNVIGAGGTGSNVITALANIHQSLLALDHPGLSVNLFDNDTVSTANLGRQQFTTAEIGLPKAVALINKENRRIGSNWKAINKRYDRELIETTEGRYDANLTITCVDTVSARMEIADILKKQSAKQKATYVKPMYWMDFGNSQFTGQVILSTVGNIKQPNSKKFRTVESLPFITDEFRDLLIRSENEDDTPSCSLAEALEKQDLFINASLAKMGSSLLWSMFRNGMVEVRGFFLNLKDFRMQPLKVG